MNILLIDDHKLFCESLKIILEMDERISKVNVIHGKESLDEIKGNIYDIIVIDINLGNSFNENGIELSCKILEKYPDEKIVILTGYNKTMYEYESMKAGAKAFINKDIDPNLLIDKFIDVCNNSKVFDLEVENMYRGRKTIVKKENIIIEDLTFKERMILNNIRVGMEVDDLAKDMGVSKRTIFNHLGNIYSKLNVNNRQEAIYIAEKMGYFLP